MVKVCRKKAWTMDHVTTVYSVRGGGWLSADGLYVLLLHRRAVMREASTKERREQQHYGYLLPM